MSLCSGRSPANLRLSRNAGGRAVMARVAAPESEMRSTESQRTVSMVSLGCPKNTVDGTLAKSRLALKCRTHVQHQ